MFDEQQERVPPAPSGQGGTDERLAAGAGGGSGGAEERKRRGQRKRAAEETRPRPMRAHILSIFRFLNHFHFYLGDQLNLDSLSVSIGLITDRESPKLLPVREITLTNKLVTCVLTGPCDTKALCSFWLENHPAQHRLETNQIMT